MTYKDIKHNKEVNELLKKGNQNLGLLGYTDHSQDHCVRVAETAAHILKKFGAETTGAPFSFYRGTVTPMRLTREAFWNSHTGGQI